MAMKPLRGIDWKTLALELVIVFVGLFGALQLDEWREDRELDERERQMLVRLQEELGTTMRGLGGDDGTGGMVGFLDRNRKAVEYVVRSLEAGTIVDADTATFEYGLTFYGHLPDLGISRGADQELLASGAFSRIDRPELRAAIGGFYGQAGWTENNFSWWRGSAERTTDLIWSRVRYTLADSDDNLYGHGPVEYDFDELAADRELFNGLYWSRDNQNDWYELATELHQSAATVYALLDDYLATHHGS